MPATFEPTVHYRDPKAALGWLARAFGFELTLLIDDPSGGPNIHAEMRFGEGAISVGGEWSDTVRSPVSVGGVNTQSIQVALDAGIDEHCERARAAGARILVEPTDEPWGGRRYRAEDLEGHVWSFQQMMRNVSREEFEHTTGLNTEGWSQR